MGIVKLHLNSTYNFILYFILELFSILRLVASSLFPKGFESVKPLEWVKGNTDLLVQIVL